MITAMEASLQIETLSQFSHKSSRCSRVLYLGSLCRRRTLIEGLGPHTIQSQIAFHPGCLIKTCPILRKAMIKSRPNISLASHLC